MADTVNIHEAKTHLSRLLERVRRGHSVTIAKAGIPVARLIPVGKGSSRQLRESTALPTSVSPDRGTRLRRLLEQEVWPLIPASERGRVLSREEEDAILGFGSRGE